MIWVINRNGLPEFLPGRGPDEGIQWFKYAEHNGYGLGSRIRNFERYEIRGCAADKIILWLEH